MIVFLDSTKSITFKSNINITDDKVVVKSERFSVDRRDWGLTYHKEGSVNIPKNYIISNMIEFEVDITVGR